MTIESKVEVITKRVTALAAAVAKFNPCHSPATGEFCSTGGKGGSGRGGSYSGSLKIASSSPNAASMSKAAVSAANVLGDTGKFHGIHTTKGITATGRGGNNDFFGVKVVIEPSGSWKASVTSSGSLRPTVNRGKGGKAMAEFVDRWNIKGGQKPVDAAERRALRFESAGGR